MAPATFKTAACDRSATSPHKKIGHFEANAAFACPEFGSAEQ